MLKHAEHDLRPGKISRCQITGSEEYFEIIDLGHQPPCAALLTPAMLDRPELTYPLRLLHFPESGLAQLDYVVDPEVIFYPEYPYRSGISKPLEDYQRSFADRVVERFGAGRDSLCVDIGSNDGTLLTGFRRRGLKTLGIEPTNVAVIAREENGIETIQRFFDEPLAREIAADYGKAQFITMTNVFAHVANLGEMMRGLCSLLDDDGIFITESQYLLDMLQKNQFDGIYHEHIRTYSLKSLVTLFPLYGMEVFDVERGERYGGNIRAYAAWKGKQIVHARVGELLKVEEETGLHSPEVWSGFRRRVADNRDAFMELAYAASSEGAKLVGNSCPGRCATLLNYYGVDVHLMPYIAELPASLKLGMFLPGTRIPIVRNERLFEEQPPYVVLLAWHYAEYMAKRLRADGLRSKFIAPLPELTVLDW